jgi:Family of unknown function (DUF6866) N-terminal domain/Family of unknown function (DUF6866) C-terminal domain
VFILQSHRAERRRISMTQKNGSSDPSTDRNKILREILPAIQKNCDISDAHHSGLFSLCGLFLRLKDLYNWEQRNPPWNPTDKDRLLKWIDGKEALWLECHEYPYASLRLNGSTFHHFDHQKINRILNPAGFYYGAGYGRGLKPTFFLGTIKEKRHFQGYTIMILDRDLVCDLSFTPAQRQGKTIILRLDPLRFFLWAKMQETEQAEREAAALALDYYEWTPALPPDKQFEPIVQSEMETVLFHELGEAKDRTFPPNLWRSLLTRFPFSRIELVLRTLKDLLADTHPGGTLAYLVRERKPGSLAFYLANLKGLRRSLFPEIVQSINAFKETKDWSDIESARKKGRHRLIRQARRIGEPAAKWLPSEPEKFSDWMEREFFKPLGL